MSSLNSACYESRQTSADNASDVRNHFYVTMFVDKRNRKWLISHVKTALVCMTAQIAFAELSKH